MSSEPIASAPQAREAPQAEFVADAELVLAALSRMESAVQADRAALARLRPALAELAGALRNAKQAVTFGAEQPPDIAMLLDALEHRVDAMIEIAGETPSPPPIEPAALRDEDRPAVSAVVSRLGRDEDSPVGTPEAGPSVFELEAMVQALSAPTLETQAPPDMEAVATTEPSPPATPADTPETESAWLARISELQASPAPAPQALVSEPALGSPTVEPAEPPTTTTAAPANGVVSKATPDIDDLAELLFEPNPDLPVAAEPQAGPQPPAPASAAAEPAPDAPAAGQELAPNEPASEKRRSYDPLAPLYAMSPEERLALFS